MPEPVVDLLEPVQVEQQHGHRSPVAQGQAQPPVEQQPVGQPGELVAVREPTQPDHQPEVLVGGQPLTDGEGRQQHHHGHEHQLRGLPGGPTRQHHSDDRPTHRQVRQRHPPPRRQRRLGGVVGAVTVRWRRIPGGQADQQVTQRPTQVDRVTGGVVGAGDKRHVDDVGDDPQGEARREDAHRPPHRPGRAGHRDQDGELHQVEHREEQPQRARRIGQLGGGDPTEDQHPTDRHQGQGDDHPVQQRTGPPDRGPWCGRRTEQRGRAGENAGGEDHPDHRRVRQVTADEPLRRPDRPADRGERHGEGEQRPEPAQRRRMPTGHPDTRERRPAGDQHRADVTDQRGARQRGDQPARLQQDDRSRDERADGVERPRSLLTVLSGHGRSGPFVVRAPSAGPVHGKPRKPNQRSETPPEPNVHAVPAPGSTAGRSVPG